MAVEFVITEDLIEDNLIKCFSPIHFVQYILASGRVRIKNNVVTYTTTLQTAYSNIWLALVSISSSFFHLFYFETFYHRDMMMYLICFLGTVLPVVSYLLNLFVNRFTQRDNNVKIYAMLQKVDRLLQLEKHTYYTDFQYRLNIFVIFLIVFGFLFGFAAHAISLLEKPGYTVFYAVGILTIYMDILLGIGMIYFLAVRVCILNEIIKNIIREYKGNVEKKTKARTLKKTVLSFIIPKVQPSSLKITHYKWLECVQNILRCYRIITELFSFSMLNISLTVLIWSFFVIGGVVVGNRKEIYPLFASITLAMWAVFYYILLTVSAVFSDWFILEVKKLKLLCIRLIAYNYDGPYQKTASKMIRAIHYDTPVFVVYGIFVFDRRIPLEIIGVIAANVIVLIQFII